MLELKEVKQKTKKKKKNQQQKREKKEKKIVSRALIHITSISLCHLILGR